MDLTRAIVGVATALALGACGGHGSAAPDLGPEETIGRAFVDQRGCATCHDQHGSAGTALAGGVQVVPGVYSANLTSDVSGLGRWADIEIVRAMRYGVDDEQEELCPSMPRFDGSDPKYPFMTDVEANAIIAYLRTLPPVAGEVPESQCPPIKPRARNDMGSP